MTARARQSPAPAKSRVVMTKPLPPPIDIIDIIRLEDSDSSVSRSVVRTPPPSEGSKEVVVRKGPAAMRSRNLKNRSKRRKMPQMPKPLPLPEDSVINLEESTSRKSGHRDLFSTGTPSSSDSVEEVVQKTQAPACSQDKRKGRSLGKSQVCSLPQSVPKSSNKAKRKTKQGRPSTCSRSAKRIQRMCVALLESPEVTEKPTEGRKGTDKSKKHSSKVIIIP